MASTIRNRMRKSQSDPTSSDRRRRALPLRLESLETRTAPSAGLGNDRFAPLPVGLPSPANTNLLNINAASFDAAGNPRLGEKTRIDQPLLQLFNNYRLSQQRGWTTVEASAPSMNIVGDRVQVRITANNMTTLMPALVQVGYEELAGRPDLLFTEGMIPIGSMPALDKLTSAGLAGVITSYLPGTSVGLVTSQADWQLESDRLRNSLPNFFDGSGQRIGVLSDSFNNLGGAAADVANNDLSPVQVLQDLGAGGIDEGRAMLQLIHDVAPGAALAFATAFVGGEAGFAANIGKLADPAQGNALTIVDDIFYFEEPMYQDGVIAQAITAARVNRNVAYFSSAGNHENQGYESTVFPTGTDAAYGTNSYDFDPGAGIDTRMRVTIAAGQGVRLVMQWDDPFYQVGKVNTDLDIYLRRADTDVQVASSARFNITTNLPSEIIQYTNTTGATTQFDIVVRNFSGPNPIRFKFVNLSNGNPIVFNEYFGAGASTVTPHASVPDAESVAAIPYFNQTVPEPFTSLGPNVVLFSPDGGTQFVAQTRTAPYISAQDNTDTTFFGFDVDGNGFPNFSGTSAAAPHAAAVAALVRQSNPTISPFDIYFRLEGTADASVNTPGFDFLTGFGLINAYDAVVGFSTADSVNFTDGFETSVLSRAWETRSTGAGRIEVSSANAPATGTRHVTLDSDRDGFNSRNELILHANLQNARNVVLSFNQKEFGDEDNAMPATFVGSGDFDGVALSVDGTNWIRLVSLTGANSTGTYQAFSFNLNKIAADNFITLNSNTLIKFQQFDNFGIATGPDGMAFDDIVISRKGMLTGTTYDDQNGDGSKQGGEPGVANRVVYLDENFNGQWDPGFPRKWASAQLPVTLPDLTTTIHPLTVSGIGGTLSDVNVKINLNHTWDGDLVISVISPAGTRVVLSNRRGSSGDNFIDTIFDDQAATAIGAGSAPFTGRFIPDGSLSALNGEGFSGTWLLEVSDRAGGDTGILNSWSLELSRTFSSTNVPQNITDFATASSIVNVGGLAGNISDVNVTLDITHSWDADLDVSLTSTNGGGTIALFQDVGSSDDNFTNTTLDDEAATDIALGAAPFSGRFRPQVSLSAFDNLTPNATWTLSIFDDASGDTGTLNSWSIEVGRTFSAGAPVVNIPGATTVDSTIQVSNISTGPILDIDVNLDITHTWDADVTATLKAPDGTVITLVSDQGLSTDNFTNSTFDDESLVPISAGKGAFTGRYRPQQPLSNFDGKNANGTWTLTVSDAVSADSGTLNGWSMTIRSADSYTNSTPLPINDKVTQVSQLLVSGVVGTIADLNAAFDITHTWDGDVSVSLIAPDGTRANLVNRRGSSGDNFTNTRFDDETATSITTGSAPFNGVFRPEQSLTAFDGIDPNGLWTLEISDLAGGDTGTLNSWNITFATGERYTVSDAAGNYEMGNLDAGGFYNLREQLPIGWRRTEPVGGSHFPSIPDGGGVAGLNFGAIMDTTAPTVNVVDVAPDPRNTAVNSIQIVFSEPVSGLDVGDLILSRDGGINLLTGGESLTSGDGVTWTLSGLAALTNVAGEYLLAVNAFGAEVVDQAGNALASSATDGWRLDLTSPTVTDIKVNDGTVQRSRVTSLTVTFSELVNVSVASFNLVQTLPAPGAVTIAGVDVSGSTPTQTIAKLTFSGAYTQAGDAGKSLIDGRYTLSVVGANYTDLAGNAGTNSSQNFHRLFGDIDGNATINTVDFNAFRTAFGGTSFAFDFNGNNAIETIDFNAFRARFGSSV